MKKKLIFSIALASLMFTTSCDMDLAPIGSLDEESAIQTTTDATSVRNYMYVVARSVTTSEFFTYSDIQCDMFNGLTINGNRKGTIANGTISSGDSDITGWWATMYAAIANINYFLEYAEPLRDKYQEENNETAVAKLNRFIGEAHFFRAFYYCLLFDRWCTVYTSAKGDVEGLGLPIVTKYDPTSDRSKYPGRSSMNETINFINDELGQAYTLLEAYEEDPYDDFAENPLESMASYVSTYAVDALWARLNLWIGNYQKAIDYAQLVINSGKYALASLTNYANMWEKDSSSEIIFMPFETSQELGNAIGAAWLSIYDTAADYVPNATMIEYLESWGKHRVYGWNDVRCASFLGDRNLIVNGNTYPTTCFYKFPGNTSLQVSGVNLMNKSKTFRASEMYLIVAEAAAALNQTDLANEALNTLMQQRIRTWEDVSLTGAALMAEIRLQRGYELCGEGFRLSDLRRWEQGFDRADGINYENADVVNILTPAGLEVIYSNDDYRYTWPIPSDELTSNPQIRNQQNPGY